MSQIDEKSVARVTAILVEIVQQIVSVPDAVSVEARTMGSITTLCLGVAQDDIQALVGSGGKTARSLRTVIAAFASRFSLDMNLEIVVQTNL